MFNIVRIKIARVLLKVVLYSSLSVGIIPPIYKFFKHPKAVKCYCIFINCVVSGIILSLVPYFKVYMRKVDSLGRLVTQLLNNWMALTVFFIIIKHRKVKEEQSQLIAEAEKLRHGYFKGKDIESSYFARHVILRCLVNFFQLVCTVMSMLASYSPNSLSFYSILTMVATLQSVLFAVEAQYFYGLLYLSCYYEQLSKDLLAVEKKIAISGRKCQLAVEIDCIAAMYFRLFYLERRLTAVYKFSISLILFNIVAVNVARTFNFLVFLTGKFQGARNYSFSFYPIMISTCIALLFLDVNVCERLLNNARAVRETLKIFTDQEKLDVHLYRSIETMAIQCSRVFPKISIGGFFVLDHQNGFEAFIVIVFSLVVLVQYDYNNLY